MFVIPNAISTFLENLSLPKGPIVVGVSGGADSLYLTYILAHWCAQRGNALIAVTVNHGLRPEASKEAQWVHNQLTKQSILHEILTWTGPKPSTHIEEKAREKRYQLLLDFCHKQKASALFLAHHEQDQAETFWARLSRGSGVDGLSAMAPITKRDGILIIRPLLQISKDLILKTLKEKHLKWIEDPMNQDAIYERVQWRNYQNQLTKIGLNTTILSKTTQRLQRARKALDFYAQQFIETNTQKSPLGFIQISQKIFLEIPAEIRVRVLAQLLQILSPIHKPISLESVEKIALNLPKHATLAGCQWVISQHQIFLANETKYLISKNIPPYQWTPWGSCLIYTNKSFKAQAVAPKPRLKKIPFLVQRTFLNIPQGFGFSLIQQMPCNQKELEKKLKLDYKNKRFKILTKFIEQKETT